MSRFQFAVRVGVCSLLLVCLLTSSARTAENLLANPGFESPLEPTWHKRTPDDKTRKLYSLANAGRNGTSAAVLENLEPSYTRLRQGNECTINVAPGSLVEMTTWVRSDMSGSARITTQLYCMDADHHILAQPRSPVLTGSFDWTPTSVLVVVPDGTAHVMAYLQVQEGVGRVFFDDVELAVKHEPLEVPPAPKVILLSDLADDDECVVSLKTLFEDGLVRKTPGDALETDDAAGILMLFGTEAVPESVYREVESFARSGGSVFMDIRNFAEWQGTEAIPVNVGEVEDRSASEQMQCGLRIVAESPVTAGFRVGQIMSRAGFPEGNLQVLPKQFRREGLELLAVAPDGEPGLVRLPVGQGSVVAADVLSLREPFCRNVEAYYKYLPITNTLTNRVQFGRYFPEKLSYAEFVERMKSAARLSPKIRFEEEGPASDGQPICSLNLGRPGKPLYFFYAAAHGSEWEPGYGLLAFAEQLAEGRFADVVDLDQVEIKIIPLLNPSGYDATRRQNANGVDINRQGDFAWQRFKGRDSNEDGTYGPFDYDWKGTAPLTEPEARVYRAIAERENLYCILDFHGNSSATSNKMGIRPYTARADNAVHAIRLQQIANARLRGRHLLRQVPEEHCKQYLLERVRNGGRTPYLMNVSAQDRYGLLIELTAGYPASYGTVLQTDVTCELCRALFVAYPPGE